MARIWPRSSPSAACLAATALLAGAAGAGCGFHASATGQSHDDAGIDALGAVDGPDSTDATGAVDAIAVDAAAGTACYGPSGAWQVCLGGAPTGLVDLPLTLDTDTDAHCLAAQPAGWTPAQPPACFVVGDTVTVAMTTVTGSRPLVVVAQTRITVDVALDVASHHGGKLPAASPSSACKAFGATPSGGGGGGGGGAGGSFMLRGGNGGTGDAGNNQNGQASQAEASAPAQLRGGCAGQAGSGAAATDVGGGGGAVYLLSAGQIIVTGAITASGGGGAGGNAQTGGSGGGSGGMIVLFGAMITAPTTAVVTANGGGGASGGSKTAGGVDGADPTTTLPLLAAPGGSNGMAGTGGKGFPATGNTLDATGGPNREGGGGGGGGAGYIRVNHAIGLATVSPGADLVP